MVKPVSGGSVSTAPTPSSFPFFGQDERERTDKSDNAVVTQRGSYVALPLGFTLWSGSICRKLDRAETMVTELQSIYCTLQSTVLYSTLFSTVHCTKNSENRHFSANSNRNRFAD